MRTLLLALFALALSTTAAAAPPPPLPELPGLSAGCLGAELRIGSAGASVDPPACFVNDVAAPDAEPVGTGFPQVPLPPLPELPETPPLPPLPA